MRVNKDYLVSEAPYRANIFLNRFMTIKEQYPPQNFRTPGWIHSTNKMWWSMIVRLMMSTFEAILEDLGLYGVTRNVQFGLSKSFYHLFSILDVQPYLWHFLYAGR